MRKPEIKTADLIAEALYQAEPPELLGDVGRRQRLCHRNPSRRPALR
jgi:hypothetical protein